jgi:hypothetical protein
MVKTKKTGAEVTTRPMAPVATITFGRYRVTGFLGDVDAAKRLSVLHALDALARAAAWSAVEQRGPESWIAQLNRTDIRRDLLHVEKIAD